MRHPADLEATRALVARTRRTADEYAQMAEDERRKGDWPTARRYGDKAEHLRDLIAGWEAS